MINMTGREWKRFYSDAKVWPYGTCHEGEEITVDGKTPGDDFDLSAVPDEANMTLAGGVVYFNKFHEGPTLEAYFKRWRKRQTTTTLVVEVPNEAAEAVRAAIAAAGGTVQV